MQLQNMSSGCVLGILHKNGVLLIRDFLLILQAAYYKQQNTRKTCLFNHLFFASLCTGLMLILLVSL